MLLDFKDSDFDEKIKNEKVSVILYSAIWCNPCKVYKPVLSNLSEQFKDKANFYYGDIENSFSADVSISIPRPGDWGTSM